MTPDIKICGLKTAETMEAALSAGATHVGLVLVEKSPRHIALPDAIALAEQARGRALIVVLVVDPTDAELDAIVETLAPDVIQLHGHESQARVVEIATRYGTPILKEFGIREPADLTAARWMAEPDALPVDGLVLFDAKPNAESGAELTGGNGQLFDWAVLDGWPEGVPFMLSGGLTPDNVAAAVRQTKATALDVSSGVEASRGEKSPELIRAFIDAARSAVRETV